VPSENKDSRVAVIVIHHTSSDFGDSLHVLTKRTSRPVSSHYLIPEPGDPSYDKDKLHVYALVPEEERAWHAGTSYWKGLSKLNNVSVGIELVNRTYCHEPQTRPAAGESDWPADTFCFYPDFDDGQIALLVDLLEELKERHVEVDPTHIVGHADIAPQRKIDPGPRFPWQRLHKLGFGAWYDDETVGRYWDRFQFVLPSTGLMQEALHAYGYPIEQTGVYDEQMKNVLRAFQGHFLPWKVTGRIDTDTAAVLYALIEKYYPEELDPLLPPPADALMAPSGSGGN
jgi:N-acetylmuramoyl-L-alanine amidase